MEMNRAKEILESPANIRVLYKDQPVWIKSLDVNRQTAHISSSQLNPPEQDVPVANLTE